MGVIVTFNYAQWIAAYPEFAGVNEARAQGFFNIATLYQANDGSGPITNPAVALTLLDMMTAHVASLSGALNPGGTPSGVVGRISSATEGSVSVQTEFKAEDSAQWFLQTPYGAAWWAATARFRLGYYVPGYTFAAQRGPLGPVFRGRGFGRRC